MTDSSALGHVKVPRRRQPAIWASGALAALLIVVGLPPASAAHGAPRPGRVATSIGELLAILPNPYLSLGFGASVAVSGKTAVVDNSVYTKGRGGWPTTPTAVLNESGEVAISGSTIVVGSSEAGPTESGEAYIYVRGRTGWPPTPTVVLDDPHATANDGFGNTVAISGSTLVVGTRPSPTNLQDGMDFVYTRSGRAWGTTPTAVLVPPPSDRFRASLALTGGTAIIGGFSASANANVAFIYSESKGRWPATPTASLDDPTADTTDCFGEAVGVSGATAVVGDWCTSSGRAYIYSRHNDRWTAIPSTTLSPLPGHSRELSEFGLAISMSQQTIIVGAPGFDRESGEAYIYRRGNTGLWPTAPNASLTDPAATGQDRLGVSLALSNGIAIVGAPGTPQSEPFASGVAYVYGA